jgi:PAS domain S-box-containing protein
MRAGTLFDRRLVLCMIEEPAINEILDQLAEALIFTAVSGNIVLWNRASTALFGFKKDEAIGQSLDLIIPPHLRNAHWAGFEAAVKTGRLKLGGKPTLTRAMHKSGRRVYVEMSFALVKSAQGVIGSVAVARDVTERVERERATTSG